MTKEHKKLYKAGKNWLVATLAVTSLGVIASQQQVSADSAPASDEETVTTNNSVAVKSAQQAKDQAQVAYDQQSQQVTADSTAVSAAQSSADAADKNLAEAKEKATAAGATSENIASASAAVTAQQKVVNVLEAQLNKSGSSSTSSSTESSASSTSKPSTFSTAKPSAMDPEALAQSIENNQIALPAGYVDAFNNEMTAIGQLNKVLHAQITGDYDETAYSKAQYAVSSAVSNFQKVAQGLKNNQFHHNDNDKQVAIKDINNLDNDVATNLSLWYAGVLNQLAAKYDFKNVNGTLLRDAMNLKVTNYSLNTTKYINNQISKNVPIDDLINAKNGANNIEGELLDSSIPLDQISLDNAKFDQRPAFLKVIDAVSTPWGYTSSIAGQTISNLDQLKEAVWNNLILYNLTGVNAKNPGNDGSGIDRLKNDEKSSLASGYNDGASIFGPYLYMRSTPVSANVGVDDQFSFALAVDNGGQITPHWYHVAKAFQNDKDNQAIQPSTAAKTMMVLAAATPNSDVNALQKQYNDAKTKLATLKDNLAKLEQAAKDVKTAQKASDDAHAKLTAAKEKLQKDQAKLATLKTALDAAIAKLNAVKGNNSSSSQPTDSGNKGENKPTNDGTSTNSTPSDNHQSTGNDSSKNNSSTTNTDNNSEKNNPVVTPDHQSTNNSSTTTNSDITVDNHQDTNDGSSVVTNSTTSVATNDEAQVVSHNDETNASLSNVAVAKSTENKNSANNVATTQLPQTGDQNSVIAGLLGGVLAMFGLGLLKKRVY